MSIIKEFKDFAIKGNAINLAVGVVIGSAFQAIVNSLVNDIIMPFTAVFTGKIDYSDWKIVIGEGVAEIGIGSFINALINFFIIAFSIFLAFKYIRKLNKKIEQINKETINKMRKEVLKINKEVEEKQDEEEIIKEPETKTCPFCFSEIPYKATRCAHCTSELENIIEKNKILEENINGK